MKNRAKLMFWSIVMALCWVTVLPGNCFGQGSNSLQIDTAEVAEYKNGKYQIILFLNEGPSCTTDTYFENNLNDPKNYVLKEKTTEKEIKLPAVSVYISQDDRYQITLVNVDITHKKKYTIGFREPLPAVQPKLLVFMEGQGTDEFEKGKPIPWETSIKPKISQGDSTIRELGDLGFELSLERKLFKKFEFSILASKPSSHRTEIASLCERLYPWHKWEGHDHLHT